MTEHTPGPWTWDKPEYWPNYEDEEGWLGGFYSGEQEIMLFGDSTHFYPTDGSPPSEADAKLIAAAPDLLAALRDMAQRYPESITQGALDAIEKATR